METGFRWVFGAVALDDRVAAVSGGSAEGVEGMVAWDCPMVCSPAPSMANVADCSSDG